MTSKRVQLFEFNDHERVPPALRATIVESLSRVLERHGMLAGLAPVIHRFLEESGTREVLDLCSGAAGPVRIVASEMKRVGLPLPRFLLTDLYPHPDVWAAARAEHPDAIDFIETPIDATKIPKEVSAGRARVIINAFHHFPPALGTAILEDAVRSRAPFLVAESFERTPLGVVPFLIAGPPMMLTAPLWSRRERLEKAVLTWLTPVALLAGLWDLMVSSCRVYTEDELRAMVGDVDGYRFEYGNFRFSPFGRGYYFFGAPSPLT